MRLIGLAVVLSLFSAPLVAEAQQAGNIQRVGYLGYDAPGSDPSGIAGLRQGLRDLGYIEGQNIVIEYRFAEGRPDRLPGLITELTNLKVGVLITQGAAVTAAAKRATTTTPIVSVSADPVGMGLVESTRTPAGTSPDSRSAKEGTSAERGSNLSGIPCRRPRAWVSSGIRPTAP